MTEYGLLLDELCFCSIARERKKAEKKSVASSSYPLGRELSRSERARSASAVTQDMEVDM